MSGSGYYLPPLGGRRADSGGHDALPPLGGRPYAGSQAQAIEIEQFTAAFARSVHRHFGWRIDDKAPLCRTYRSEIAEVNESRRTVTARIGSNCVDRYNTVIMAHGIDTSEFLRNPTILWEHGRDIARGAMPVGTCVSIDHVIGPTGPELVARAKFFDDDEFSERLFRRYRAGDMAAWSVNVIPHPDHCSPPTRSEIAERPELASCAMVYRRSNLAEFSAVSVGGNADALTIDKRRSFSGYSRSLIAC